MADFVRKDLSRCFLWPSREYWKQLDAYVDELEEENDYLQEQLAKSSGNYYLRDAAEWTERWNELQRKFGELQAEKIRLEAELQMEIRRRDMEIEYLQEQLEIIEETGRPKSSRKRDGRSGRFVSNMPRKEKVFQAHRMKTQGYKISEIARELKVSSDTVKRYLRERDSQFEDPEEDDSDGYDEYGQNETDGYDFEYED